MTITELIDMLKGFQKEVGRNEPVNFHLIFPPDAEDNYADLEFIGIDIEPSLCCSCPIEICLKFKQARNVK